MNVQGWSKQTICGAEEETGQLLYALVRLIKPKLCVETGCAHGDTAFKIGTGLWENGHGGLHTCDLDVQRVAETRKRCDGLPVTVHEKPGVEVIQGLENIDFAFIDSGWTQVREAEVEVLAAHLRDNAIVVLHDVCQNYNGVYQKAKEVFGKHGLVLDTPYGVAVFQMGEPQFTHLGKMVEID